MNNMNEKTFILLLILISFIPRIILAFLHIQYPGIPHDFEVYLGGANLLLTGKPFYGVILDLELNRLFQYGPLLASIIAGWVYIFGSDYFLLKFPSIIFDCLTIIPFFYLIKRLSNQQIAKSLTIIFTFSDILLYTSGMTGDDDAIMMFFIILASYLLVNRKHKLSAVTLAIACGFKVVPFILLPPIILYLYKGFGLRQIFKYLFLFIIAFLMILFPFYLNSGINVLHPYLGAHKTLISTPTLLAPLNLIRIIMGICMNAIHYLSTHTMIPYNENPLKSSVAHPINIFFDKISTPFLILGFILISWYILKFRMKNIEFEFIRNSFLFILTTLFFDKGMYYVYFIWLIPFFISIIAFREIENFRYVILKKVEILGIIMVFIGLLIHACLFRWSSDIPEWQRVLFLMNPFLIAAGTYFMFFRSEFKIAWVLIVFAYASYREGLVNVLLVFKPILVKFIPDTPIGPFATYLSYSTMFIQQFFDIILIIIGMILLFIKVHKQLKLYILK